MNDMSAEAPYLSERAVLFNENTARLKVAVESYKPKPWVNGGGNPWRHEKWHPSMNCANFGQRWVFLPEYYDPARPYESEGRLWVPERNRIKLIEVLLI